MNIFNKTIIAMFVILISAMVLPIMYFNLIAIVLIGFCLYLGFIRNNKVYNFRMKVLDESPEEYHKLPDYDEMLIKFWKPLESFMEEKHDQRKRAG